VNSESNNCCGCRIRLPYGLAILSAFLIVAVLVGIMRHYTQPAPAVDRARKDERAKALAELRAAEADALHSVAWMDQARGIVRLRIEDALILAEREWKNPAAARSNLVARVEKATAVAPPPPAKPSEFE
jgi:hypothetical protein